MYRNTCLKALNKLGNQVERVEKREETQERELSATRDDSQTPSGREGG